MPDHVHPIRVFLADDSALMRSRIATLLETDTMVIAGQAETPDGSIDGILAVRPDVVVLDVQLASGPGLRVLRAVRQAAPGIAFVVFSNNAGPAYRKRYLEEGAACFLDKSTESNLLVHAVAGASALARRHDHINPGKNHAHSHA